MDLTSKQRAQLRGLANGIDTILHVGKDGLGDNLIKQADDALEARELIKGKVLENSMLTAREAAEDLAKATRSEVVQVIGTKFVLYRQSHNKDKKDRIVLVKDKRQNGFFLKAENDFTVRSVYKSIHTDRTQKSPHSGILEEQSRKEECSQ